MTMELAHAEGIAVVERDLTPTETLNADEAFLTGTGTEITPVVRVEAKIADVGASGALTERLAGRYAALVRREGAFIGA